MKEQVISKTKKRIIEEMSRRTKCRTVENDMWERKKYIKESNIGTIKDVIKIRLHVWEFKVNYGRKGLEEKCPICQPERILQRKS